MGASNPAGAWNQMKSWMGSQSMVMPVAGSDIRVCGNATRSHCGTHWMLPWYCQPSGSRKTIASLLPACGSTMALRPKRTVLAGVWTLVPADADGTDGAGVPPPGTLPGDRAGPIWNVGVPRLLAEPHAVTKAATTISAASVRGCSMLSG